MEWKNAPEETGAPAGTKRKTNSWTHWIAFPSGNLIGMDNTLGAMWHESSHATQEEAMKWADEQMIQTNTQD